MATDVTATSEHGEARRFVAALVRRQGARLRSATPTGMIAALVAAACMPVARQLLDGGVPEAAKAAVALLGSVGGGYIGEFITTAIERLRKQDGAPNDQAGLQEVLEHELLGLLRSESEQSAKLRAEAAVLLERVQAVEVALGAASAETQLALTDAFTQVGVSFGEFAWMLREARHTLEGIEKEQARQGVEHRHQIESLREIRVKLNLALRRLDALTAPAAPPAATETLALAEGEQGPAPAPGLSPYKGLEAFEPEDAEWFFGRDELVAGLVVRLSEAAFLAVMGPSGAGKSSVLKAGLLPAVWSARVPGARAWTTIAMAPGAHPLQELAARVGAECNLPAGLLFDDWRADPGRLGLALRQVLATAPATTRLLLLVDQFEEVFTQGSDEAERRGFIRALVAATGYPGVNVVLGVRADFSARCAEYPELVAAMQDRQVMVGAMTQGELRQAIVGPAARGGWVLEPGLVETVLADLGEEPGSLPLLSHALFATWQRREGRMLTLAGYREAGGVSRAIAQTAEGVYRELDPARQAIARDVFLRLTALGEGTEDTRRRVRRGELAPGRDAGVVGEVLERLARARLVILGEDRVELSHEALIREWPTLRRWLAEDREGLRIHRRLTEAAAEWEAHGREPSLLYQGVNLASARGWAEAGRARLNDSEQAFLAASSKRERDQLVTARRRARVLAVLSALLVVASVGALWQASTARRQRDLATARQLTAQAAANSDQQPLSLLLSLESRRIAPTNEAWASLLQGLLHPSHNALVLAGHADDVLGVAFSLDGTTLASAGADGKVRLWDTATGKPIGPPLTGHRDDVYGVAFSPDGKTLASGSDDNTVRLWDVDTHEQIRQPLTDHGDDVYGVAFSPNGEILASAGEDGTVRLWKVDTHEPIGDPLIGHEGPVRGVAFSPNGEILASAGDDGKVRLWKVATGEQIGEPLTGHTDIVFGVAFSPDGTTLASGSDDNTVRLWKVATGEQIDQPLTGHDDSVLGVAFSPNGEILASAGDDDTVRLWKVATGEQIGEQIGEPLKGHKGSVRGVAFSPDGKTLASAGADDTVRLWETAIGQPIGRPLTGHEGSVRGVAFNPKGKTLASAGDETDHYGTVRLWKVATHEQIREPLKDHTDIVFGVAFSPNGEILASAGDDNTVRLWKVATREPIDRPLIKHDDSVRGVAFSPDSKTLASAGDDEKVRLWDVATGEPIGQPLTGHEGSVLGVAFSPNGKILASAGDDEKVRLWNVATGEPIGPPLIGHNDDVFGVAFSPDGKTLASAGDDGKVRLWDVATRKPIGQPMTDHEGPVRGVAFSPDGKTLASAGDDDTVRLWDVATGKPIGDSLTGHEGSVLGVAFSPNGKTLASAGDDGTVRLWPAGPDAWVRYACRRAGRNLTKQEWNQNLPGRRYERTCPHLPSG